MENTVTYKQSTYSGNTVYITVQVAETRPAQNLSILRLGMYVENSTGTALQVLGSSGLGLPAYEGTGAQSFTFQTPVALPLSSPTQIAQDLEVQVRHNALGQAQGIPLWWTWNVKAMDGARMTGRLTFDLPDLELATTPGIMGSSFQEPGGSLPLRLNACRATMTHDLTYEVEGQTGEIACGVKGQVLWTIPEELLAVLHSREYQRQKVICTTWENGLCLGTRETVFYLRPGSKGKIQGQEGWCSLRPVSDTALLTQWGVCVAGSSAMEALVDGEKLTLAPGAELAATELYLDGVLCPDTLRTPVLTEDKTYSLELRLTDSRGYTLSHRQSITPLVYTEPTLSGVACFRCSAGGSPEDGGSFLKVSFVPAYALLEGNNQVQVRLAVYTMQSELLHSLTPEDGGVYGGNLDAQCSYRAELTVEDSLGRSSTVSTILPTQTVAFQIKEGGDGAAFGGLSRETDCLEIHWSRLRLGGSEIEDFPTEQGQTGIWHWRKWRSGLAECWGELSGSTDCSIPWGGLYASRFTPAGELPALFSQSPQWNMQALGEEGASYVLCVCTPAQSLTELPALVVAAPVQGNVSYRFQARCTGRWKD